MAVATWPASAEIVREQTLGMLLRSKLAVIRDRALLAGGASGLVAAFTIVLTLALPNVYHSSSTVVVEGEHIPDNYVRPPAQSSIPDRFILITQQILSRSQLHELIVQYKIYPGLRNRPADEVADYMHDHIIIEPRSNRSIRISYEGLDPRKVQQVTARLASLYVDLGFRNQVQQNQVMTRFLDTEADEIAKRLTEQQAAIAAYRARHADELPEMAETITAAIDQTERERASAQDSLLASRQKLEAFDQQPVHSNAQDPVEQLRAQLAVLQRSYTDKYPDIRRLKAEIKRAEALGVHTGKQQPAQAPVNTERLALEQEIARKEGDVRGFDEALNNYRERRNHIPEVTAHMAELNRDLQALQERYNALVGRRFEARLSSNLEVLNEGEHFKVLDPAPMPIHPFKPARLRLAAAGLLLSVLAGIVVPLLFAELDPSFRSEEEVRLELAEPVLGVVPAISSRSARWRQRRAIAQTILLTSAILVLLILLLRWYLTRIF